MRRVDRLPFFGGGVTMYRYALKNGLGLGGMAWMFLCFGMDTRANLKFTKELGDWNRNISVQFFANFGKSFQFVLDFFNDEYPGRTMPVMT